ncbi:MAG: metalloregulator ArsR/SmtB family transcription factor [Thermodesulfobacteriota bacterium]
MEQIAAINKALGEENRLRAVMALQGRALCVCQITELLGLAPSTVSKHMAVLRAAGLVESWKEGRWVHYRLAGRGASPAVRQALAWAAKWLQGSPRVRRDAARLQKILRLDKEALCRQQGRCRG